MSFLDRGRTVFGSLFVRGISSFGGLSTFNNDVHIEGDLLVDGLGIITGLTVDDSPYPKLDGSRPFTGPVTFPGDLVLPDSLKIGGTVEVYNVAIVDGISQYLSLDPANASHVAYYSADGLTLPGLTLADAAAPGDKSALSLDQDGRYLINTTLVIRSHATAWLLVSLPTPGNGESIYAAIAPDSVTGADGGRTEALHGSSLVDFAAGHKLSWQPGITGGDTTLADSYLSVQYLGPKS